MNKKLAVLLVVPLLVALGGTLAFSAFSGSSSVAIDNTAGHLTWTNNLTMIYTNANNTPLTFNGPNGAIYEVGAAEPYFHSSGVYHLNLGLQRYTTATSGREYTVNVTNFAPGEYIELMAVITNNGTVGFMVTPQAPTFTTSSNATYNPGTSGTDSGWDSGWDSGMSPVMCPVTPTSPSSQTINATQASNTFSFLTDLQNSTGYVYEVTPVLGFNTSLSPGGSAVMTLWIGLGNSAGQDVNYYQNSDFSLNVGLNIVSDP
ncbi:hypothetical protein [Ferroplasma acidiphilum]|uniref:hypothetical protein n=1 Tax=Ferroplasma acidiphilum TaxID=74969 RepID=UPI0023F0DBE6|nr:hypothetical protein [Ferroplasma acidiphilum]